MSTMDKDDEQKTNNVESEQYVEERTNPYAYTPPEENAMRPAHAVHVGAQPSRKRTSPMWFIGGAIVGIVTVTILFAVTELGGFIGGSGLDFKVAQVNDVVITKGAVYDAMFQQVGKSIVDKLVSEELIRAEAKKEAIEAKAADIDAELKDIKANFPSEEEFEKRLKEAGVTLDDVRKDLATNVLLKKMLEKKYPIKESDIKDYYDKNKDSFNTEEQVRASHILVKTKAEAEAVKKQLDGGEDFAKVAKEKSVDGSAQNGGDLGLFGKGAMVPPFEKAAFALDIGKVSDIVESEFGFHIIKVTEKQPAKSFTFEEKKADVQKILQQQLLSDKYDAFLKEIKKNAVIENPYAIEEPQAAAQ